MSKVSNKRKRKRDSEDVDSRTSPPHCDESVSSASVGDVDIEQIRKAMNWIEMVVERLNAIKWIPLSSEQSLDAERTLYSIKNPNEVIGKLQSEFEKSNLHQFLP